MVVHIDNGATVPVVRRFSKTNARLPHPEEQPFNKQMNRFLRKTKITARNKLRPRMQTSVKVMAEQLVTVMIKSYDQLYTNRLWRADSDIAYVHPNQHFRVLVANANNNEIDLIPRQVIAYRTLYPEMIEESNITYGEMLCIMPKDSDTDFVSSTSKCGISRPSTSTWLINENSIRVRMNNR